MVVNIPRTQREIFLDQMEGHGIRRDREAADYWTERYTATLAQKPQQLALAAPKATAEPEPEPQPEEKKKRKAKAEETEEPEAPQPLDEARAK